MKETNTNTPASPWLSPAAAARYAGVPETFIKRAHREGRLGAAKLGYRTLVFRREDIDAWLTAHYQAPRWVPASTSPETRNQLVPLPAKPARRRRVA